MYKHVTAITGPLRSGTSCVTGLLEAAGFNLGGETTRVLRRGSEANARGHLEPALLVTINRRLIQEAPEGDWDFLRLPEASAMETLASQRPNYFQLFIKKFDGQLCKDPLLCLNLDAWQRHWPALQQAVFCLRHPMAVARSKEQRYGLPIADGLKLWYEYTCRFLALDLQMPWYLLDFDALCEQPEDTFSPLLDWLERPASEQALHDILATHFDLQLVHTHPDPDLDEALPDAIRGLYQQMVWQAAEAPISPGPPAPTD